jgi:hypothetical protein
VAPLTLKVAIDQAELALAAGDMQRTRLAMRYGDRWLGLACTADGAALVLSCSGPQPGQFALLITPTPAVPSDWDVSDGHVYLQSNGFGGAGKLGFSVADDSDVPFWSEFQRLGGVDRLGYPISNRFSYHGLVTQAFQQGVLQWQPNLGQAVQLNILDDLDLAGRNAWLNAVRQIPRPSLLAIDDQGLDAAGIVSRHMALLDRYPALRDFYTAQDEALDRFGLPMGVYDFGSMVSVRLQRGTLQLLAIDSPFGAAGTIVIGSPGDMAKETGLWPLDAVTPSPVSPPTAVTE